MSSASKMFTRGGQITLSNFRMLVQINKKISNWVLLCIALITICTIYLITPSEVVHATKLYYSAFWLSKIGMSNHIFYFPWHGEMIRLDAYSVLREAYFSRQKAIFLSDATLGFKIGLLISFGLMIIATFWLIHRGKMQSKKKHVRGARIDTPKRVSKQIRKFGASNISIYKVPMIKDFETKHTLIHGTTGAGKGHVFNEFLKEIRQRGDSAIIFDKGCVFTSLFFDQNTDVILNPFDVRCCGWDLWKESRTEPDFENIAESLIPMHGESDPYWVDASRTVFSSVAYLMRNDPDRSIDKLLKLILTAELDELGEYLKGTQAATLVSGKIEKTAISIRSVISTYLKSLRFLSGLESKNGFSIREWINTVADSKESNFMYISSNAEHHSALRPLISMWLSMASISLLSLKENYNRRIWFICDELPTLHKLPQLGETIAEVRKFGGCFVLGMQSYSQLKKVYGGASASEIFDLLNTRFFFRSPSADMANLVSKELGYEDVEQATESYSYGANTIRDGISISTQRTSQPLIAASEIMDLPDLNAYIRFPAPVPITKILIEHKDQEKVALGFVLREMIEKKEVLIEDDKDDEDGGSDGGAIKQVKSILPDDKKNNDTPKDQLINDSIKKNNINNDVEREILSEEKERYTF